MQLMRPFCSSLPTNHRFKIHILSGFLGKVEFPNQRGCQSSITWLHDKRNSVKPEPVACLVCWIKRHLNNILAWFSFFPTSRPLLKFFKAVKPRFTDISIQRVRVNKISSEQVSKCLSVYSDSTWTSNPARLKPSLTTVTPIQHYPGTVLDSRQCLTSLYFFMSWSSASFNLSI